MAVASGDYIVVGGTGGSVSFTDAVGAAAGNCCCSSPGVHCALPGSCPGTAIPDVLCVEFLNFTGDGESGVDYAFTVVCHPGLGWSWPGTVDVTDWDSVGFGEFGGVPAVSWQRFPGGGTGTGCNWWTGRVLGFPLAFGYPTTITCGPPLDVEWADFATSGYLYQPNDEPGCYVITSHIRVTPGPCAADTFHGCHRSGVCADADMPDRLCLTLTKLRCSTAGPPGVSIQGVLFRGRCQWAGTLIVFNGRIVAATLTLDGSGNWLLRLATLGCCPAGTTSPGVYGTDQDEFLAAVPYTLRCPASGFRIEWDEATLHNAGNVACGDLHVKAYVTPYPCRTVSDVELDIAV